MKNVHPTIAAALAPFAPPDENHAVDPRTESAIAAGRAQIAEAQKKSREAIQAAEQAGIDTMASQFAAADIADIPAKPDASMADKKGRREYLAELAQRNAEAKALEDLQEAAPSNNLPTWSECALRVDNSEFIKKRLAEGGYGAEPDSMLATQLHRFIYEYDDKDPYRSAWFLHALELVLQEARSEAIHGTNEAKALERPPMQVLGAPLDGHSPVVATERIASWQPIDTAPHGEMVLVNDTTLGFTPWVCASCEWANKWEYDSCTLQKANPAGPNPTHWFPVPPAPYTRQDLGELS